MSSTFFFLLMLPLITVSKSWNPSSGSDKDVFILAGQSNMAGRGGVEDNRCWNGAVPPESRPSPFVLRLTAKLRWQVAHEPLHADIDVGKVCGVGPGMAFANAIVKSGAAGNYCWTRRVIGLVPCAVGGTRISEWGRGTRLYGEMVGRAGEAASDGKGRIRAVLWYQGESDTVRREDAEAYRGNLERFIRDLRCDLNDTSLPFLVVAVASGEGKFVDTVRRAQLEIGLKNVKTVDAKGLPLKSDHLHLTASSEGTEAINDKGAIETKVETMDHRVSAGEGHEPTNEKVGVVHLTRNKKQSSTAGPGGFLDSATGAVTRTLKSAKDAVMGKGKGNSDG